MIHQAFEECLFVHLTVIFVLHYYQNEAFGNKTYYWEI